MDTTTTSESKMLSTSEAARRLGASTRTIQRMIATGKLDAVRLNWAWRVPEESLEEYLSRRTAERVVTSELMKRAQRIEAAFEVVKKFRKLGSDLYVKDGKLWYGGDRDQVPQDLLQVAGRYTPELLDLLGVR